MEENQKYANEMNKLKGKLDTAMMSISKERYDGFTESIIITMYSTLARCGSYPKSPFFKELMDQTKSVAEMLKNMLDLTKVKVDEFDKVFERIMELHTEFMEEQNGRSNVRTRRVLDKGE